MAPTLYLVHPSPPVRAVRITAKAIGLNLHEKEINLNEGDHLKPEFLKINPQHTVPTLVLDDGTAIWDSHAIITYLVRKYGHKNALYPKDLLQRAKIDQRLHFESGLVFPTVLRISGKIIRHGQKVIEEDDLSAALKVYAFLEEFLNGKRWVAGDSITVADYSLISSISTLHVLVPIKGEKFPQVRAWVRRVEDLPEYEANLKGLQMFSEEIKSKLT